MCGIHAMTNVMISYSWKPQPFTIENFVTLKTTWTKVTDLLIPIMVQCGTVQGNKQNLNQSTWERSGIASIEGLGLGFGGKWLENNRDYGVSKGTRIGRVWEGTKEKQFSRYHTQSSLTSHLGVVCITQTVDKDSQL